MLAWYFTRHSKIGLVAVDVILVSELSHEQRHPHQAVVCAAWGLGGGMLAWAGVMMKRTQEARSRFGDSSLQWQQVVLLWWPSSSRSQKRQKRWRDQGTGQARRNGSGIHLLEKE